MKTFKLTAMNLFQALMIPVFLIASYGCKTQEEATRSKQSDVPLAILVDSFAEYERSAAIEIRSATVEKNILTLGVTYSGGCTDHEFKLVGSKMIQKSLPPKRGILLYHDSKGDSCRELVEKTLQFDIRCFAYEKGEIILLLRGYDTPISYTFAE